MQNSVAHPKKGSYLLLNINHSCAHPSNKQKPPYRTGRQAYYSLQAEAWVELGGAFFAARAGNFAYCNSSLKLTGTIPILIRRVRIVQFDHQTCFTQAALVRCSLTCVDLTLFTRNMIRNSRLLTQQKKFLSREMPRKTPDRDRTCGQECSAGSHGSSDTRLASLWNPRLGG